jgi:hypothetical protein
MKVIVDLILHEADVPTPRGWAEVVLTPLLGARIQSLRRALLALGNPAIPANHQSDPLPSFHCDPPPRVDPTWVLGVSREAFWWQGYEGDRVLVWETGRIPLALLEESEDRDLRSGAHSPAPETQTG